MYNNGDTWTKLLIMVCFNMKAFFDQFVLIYRSLTILCRRNKIHILLQKPKGFPCFTYQHKHPLFNLKNK